MEVLSRRGGRGASGCRCFAAARGTLAVIERRGSEPGVRGFGWEETTGLAVDSRLAADRHGGRSCMVVEAVRIGRTSRGSAVVLLALYFLARRTKLVIDSASLPAAATVARRACYSHYALCCPPLRRS